ncbi:MAG: protoporphyrinogen oxidase [Fimbriimonadaceae bacterium]|nr:protoporphyrinogen oxidase [Alphaproteobacteria bacterium]
MTLDVAIIGGGVSGLATAHDLIHLGYDVLVLERQAGVGRKAMSRRFGGFLMECGPSTVNAAAPAALAYANELGIASSALGLGAGVRKRYLHDAHKLTGVSAHPLGFLLSTYLSLPARISMLVEALRPRHLGDADETVFEFARRRFGEEFARKIMDPLCAGIFMGDARQLTIADTFPKLPEMERAHGSVIRAILAARRGSQPGRRLFSWADGIAALPRRLAEGLGARVRTGVVVTDIRRAAGGFRIVTARHGGFTTRCVVLAVQPHIAAQLLEPLDPDAASAAGDITAPPVAVAFLGYRRSQIAHPLDGLGYLATANSGSFISGAQFCSTMFAGRAPKGHVAIACYIGGMRNPEAALLPSPAIETAVHAELTGLLGISGRPVLARSCHWAYGLPQYTAGHGARRQVFEDMPKRTSGVYLTGNYLGGVSVGQCLSAARRTAEAVDQHLHQTAGQTKEEVSTNSIFTLD